jgi:hypothetical protein
VAEGSRASLQGAEKKYGLEKKYMASATAPSRSGDIFDHTLDLSRPPFRGAGHDLGSNLFDLWSHGDLHTFTAALNPSAPSSAGPTDVDDARAASACPATSTFQIVRAGWSRRNDGHFRSWLAE